MMQQRRMPVEGMVPRGQAGIQEALCDRAKTEFRTSLIQPSPADQRRFMGRSLDEMLLEAFEQGWNARAEYA